MLAVIVICLVTIAFLYATVGHGGASGYIAVLALLGYNQVFIRQDALILNLLVSGIAFWNFFRKGHFDFKAFLPLALCSIPAAFLGGMAELDTDWYKRILGALLLIPAVLFLLDKQPAEEKLRKMPLPVSLLIGAMLGFISGISGIGGGVFLSPILILGRWGGQKTTAAISAPFIFVNSAAGLMGTLNHTTVFDENVWFFGAAAVAGGFAGAALGAGRLSPFVLKKVLAAVLVLASAKLLFF